MRKWIDGLFAALILMLLAALIVPKIVGAGDNRHSHSVQSEMASIKAMLSHFKLDCGRYPTTEEGLTALRTAPKGSEGKWGPSPYADKPIVNDPTGHPYVYLSNENGFTLTSYGDDGEPGGTDDNADLIVTSDVPRETLLHSHS